MTFTESGLDCLICAIIARQRRAARRHRGCLAPARRSLERASLALLHSGWPTILKLTCWLAGKTPSTELDSAWTHQIASPKQNETEVEQLLHRNVKRFRGRLVFKAHRLLYHSTLGLRVLKKKKQHDSSRAPCRPDGDFRVFVGDLGKHVTDRQLTELLRGFKGFNPKP